MTWRFISVRRLRECTGSEFLPRNFLEIQFWVVERITRELRGDFDVRGDKVSRLFVFVVFFGMCAVYHQPMLDPYGYHFDKSTIASLATVRENKQRTNGGRK